MNLSNMMCPAVSDRFSGMNYCLLSSASYDVSYWKGFFCFIGREFVSVLLQNTARKVKSRWSIKIISFYCKKFRVVTNHSIK